MTEHEEARDIHKIVEASLKTTKERTIKASIEHGNAVMQVLWLKEEKDVKYKKALLQELHTKEKVDAARLAEQKAHQICHASYRRVYQAALRTADELAKLKEF